MNPRPAENPAAPPANPGAPARKERTWLGKMPLRELRRARGMSQQVLASRLNVKQPSIAKKEHQSDMCISTLRSHIEALGGELEIVARFPEGSVRISNFESLDERTA